MTELAPPSVATSALSGPQLAAEVQRIGEHAQIFRARARAENTRRAYESDFAVFATWCARFGISALPATPPTVAAYITAAATEKKADGSWRYAPSSLARQLSAINHRHKRDGHAPPGRHPDVEDVLDGIRRTRAQPPRRRDPLLLDDITAILDALDDRTWPGGVSAVRDSLILLGGFGSASRRSELVALRVGDVRLHRADGLHIVVRRSKGDQEGEGRIKPIPYGSRVATCAPCAFVRWVRLLVASDSGGRPALMRALAAADAEDPSLHVCRSGYVVPSALAHTMLLRPIAATGAIRAQGMTGQAVNDIVKRRAAAAGFDASELGGHSLRVGFVTEAVRRGLDSRSIRRQTDQKTDRMIDVYTRLHAPLEGNAVNGIGL